MRNIKVLVLGHKGMLGHMVVKFLQNNNINVSTIQERWPLNKQNIKNFEGDYIINCIGAIPQRTNNFDINWQLPTWLDENVDCKIIHPGTDCEIDSDKYGISKRMAADYIKTKGKQTKILKTSIIGPELNGNSSLLEWFLSQKDEVYGYTKAIWNGITTLEWSKHCLDLMVNWDKYNKSTVLYSDNVTKYELLNIIKNVYNKNINIIPKELGKNKSLVGNIKTKNIKEQLIELKSL